MQLFAPHDPRPVHFMGIAGAGMSALAVVARRRGVAVTGCDLRPEGAPDLAAHGIPVAAGHGAEHVDGARAVVVTAAVPQEHAELACARALGVPVVRRADALAAVVRGSKTVAVAGTHGKTTTTVMTTEALAAAGADPTGIAGGRVTSWGGNARLGGTSLFVVEADEYDRSFLALEPHVAVVTNVEADHLECYGGRFEDLEDAFALFASRVSRAVVGVDDPGGRRLAARLGDRAWRVSAGAESRAEVVVRAVERDPAGTSAAIDVLGCLVDVRLRVPGLHNVRNAAAALGAVAAAGADPARGAPALEWFAGVGRRFQRVGAAGGVEIIDDYAHHPTEVSATLEAARQAFPGRPLVAAFQPHLFSRTQRMGRALGEALGAADEVFVTDVYAAREAPIPGVSGEQVAASARRAGTRATYVPTLGALTEALVATLRGGDVLLVLGAGDVTDVSREILARLGGAQAVARG